MGTVGILVDRAVFHNIKSGKTGNEKLHLYNKAAAKHGLTPLYMCLERVSANGAKVHGYKYSKGKYKYVYTATPRVIHNRAMSGSSKLQKRMSQLRRRCIVFNSQTRYSKYKIHLLLKDAFSAHLPVTKRYNQSNLRDMMSQFNSLYIKPQRSSIGNGIMKVTRNQTGKWRLQLPKGSLVAMKSAVEKRVRQVARKQQYLIQETIPLAQYNGSPYDVRVSVQRGGDGKWQVTGMVGKVARKGSHVTNVARGGKVRRCAQLFKNSVKDPFGATNAVKQLSLDISRHLGERLNRLADVGLDIGVTSAGKPYFIELNCRDQRYSFKKAKMHSTFYQTYENPMRYAKYLLGSSN